MNVSMPLTNQFYEIARAALFSSNQEIGVISTSGSGMGDTLALFSPCKTVDGTEVNSVRVRYSSSQYPAISIFQFTNNNTKQANTSFGVGTGSTPAAVTDYNLEAEITSGVSISIVGNKGYEDDKTYNDFILAIKNTGSEELNIREIGMFKGFNSGNNQYTQYLYGRVVLPEALSIPVNSAKTLLVKIEL